MRNLIIVLAALTMLGACLSSSDDVPIVSEIEQDISKAQCDELGDPYAGCPAFAPTVDNCKGPSAGKDWNTAGDWVNGQPICLGFGTKIGTCSKCNYLKVPDADYSKCLNHRFVACAKAGKLPGMAGPEDTCFVTAPQSITCDKYPKGPDGKIQWPADGQATAREMCFMNPPSTAAVKECRKKAACAEKGKKVACACEPCDVYASTEYDAGSGSGTGETCNEDCEYDVAADAECQPEPPVCES